MSATNMSGATLIRENTLLPLGLMIEGFAAEWNGVLLGESDATYIARVAED